MIKNKFNLQHLRVYALIILSLVLGLEAQAFTYKGISYSVVSSSLRTAAVASNTSATDNVVIPSSVTYDGKEYTVVAISKEAFAKSTITSITMPDGLETIGDDAFINCNKLSKIVVPNSVTSIGNGSFAFCSNVTSIVYGKNVNSIGKDIFTGLSSLESVTSLNTTPPSVNTWGTTSTSATLYVPENSIDAYRNATVWRAFKTISGIQDTPVDTPIADYPFGNLKYLTIGNTIDSISNELFKGCKELENLTLGSSIQTIGDEALSGCTSLKEVILPPSVETIGASAFAGDSRLASIIMGHNVKTIGEKAFDGCSANTVSITAQTPPTAPNNTFSNYSGKLYLQGETAMKAYYDAYTCWDRFSSYVMIDAEKINIDGTDKISGKPGDTFQLTASIWPENVTLPYIFWRSTNPEIATVDANGLVTLHADLEEVLTRAQGDADIDGTCTIIAETLYNDGPVAQITVSNAGIDAVDSVAADGEGSIDYTRPYEVYNMSGLKVADSTEGLATGLYIIRQGNAAVKTAVR